MKRIIKTDKAPLALGPYSQGIIVDNMCFVSMELGIDLKTNKLISDSVEDQTKVAMIHIVNILESGEFSINDVVKITLYITDLSMFNKVNEVYRGFFMADQPARSLVVVKNLPLDAKVAVDAYAIKERVD